jgi:ribose 5-phosphate isomerase B
MKPAIAIGSDHAGYEYKQALTGFLVERGFHVEDFGTDSKAPCDYPVNIRQVAEAVARGDVEKGIVVGGSGNGEAITANRVKGVRCALCWSEESAMLAKAHNNANMIALGQRLITLETAKAIITTWLDALFEGGRHQRRIDMIDEL